MGADEGYLMDARLVCCASLEFSPALIRESFNYLCRIELQYHSGKRSAARYSKRRRVSPKERLVMVEAGAR
jgi:hypothetical protein